MPYVYQQYRRIEVGSVEAIADGSETSVDMDINVRYAKERGLTFEVSLWNLSRESWSSIQEGDPVRITLGWVDGPQSPVCLGTVEQKEPIKDGADTEYRISGVDESLTNVRIHKSQTWQDAPPERIATDIATNIDLTIAEVDSTGAVIRGTWAIKDDRPISYWLNELRRETDKRTGEQWMWEVHSGKFYFVPKSWHQTQAVTLSPERTLVSFDESTLKSDAEDTRQYDFETLCEPQIRKGSLVSVDTENHSGTYRVVDVEFSSSTSNGDHATVGKVEPVDANYPASEYVTKDDLRQRSS